MRKYHDPLYCYSFLMFLGKEFFSRTILALTWLTSPRSAFLLLTSIHGLLDLLSVLNMYGTFWDTSCKLIISHPRMAGGGGYSCKRSGGIYHRTLYNFSLIQFPGILAACIWSQRGLYILLIWSPGDGNVLMISFHYLKVSVLWYHFIISSAFHMHTLCLQLDACCVVSLFIFFTECACLLYLDLLFCGKTNDLKDNPYAFTIKLIKNNRYKYCPLENKRLQWSSKLYIPYWLQHAVYMESTWNMNHRLWTHKK